MSQGELWLGDGTFSIVSSSGATAKTFLTRGGGSFRVEREFRVIKADGDYGPVRGRVRKIEEVPVLTVNWLELPPADLALLSQPTTVSATNSTSWTPLLDLTTAHYLYQVYFTGELKDGRDVQVTVNNALNMEPLSLDLVDKDEVILKAAFTGHYTSDDRTTAPWTVTFTTA